MDKQKNDGKLIVSVLILLPSIFVRYTIALSPSIVTFPHTAKS